MAGKKYEDMFTQSFITIYRNTQMWLTNVHDIGSLGCAMQQRFYIEGTYTLLHCDSTSQYKK